MTETTASERARIVVAIDGSEPSCAALEWAAEQARLTGAVLEAAIVWDFQVSYGWVPPFPEGELASQAASVLSATVEKVLGEHADLEVVETVLEGPAKLALEHASRGASLLVTGCRGYGSFRGMLLGSVSSYLASHAHCPVAIIHAHEHGEHGVDPAAAGESR